MLPVLLIGFEEPKILTYSLESIIAEKVDSIILLMEVTGRMKDFYDLYYLAITFDFEGRKLQKAIYETLTNRERVYERDSISDIIKLTKNLEILKRWNTFCHKILNDELDFINVVTVIVEFISSPYEAILEEEVFFQNWIHEERKYF